MLEFAHVDVVLGGRAVIRDISHRVAAGSWSCLVGPNGAGKTTLLRSVVGLRRHGGTIRVGGADLAGMTSRERARRIAFVPQSPVVPEGMTVADYALLGRTPYLSMLAQPADDDRDIVASVLAALELTGFARRMLTEISGGEFQRAVLARALVQQADVLVLDEPTSALDLGQQQRALELVDQLRVERGLTVISAMHDLTLAGQYADEMLLISEGALVVAGPPGDVLAEEVLARHYGAEVRIWRGADGIAVLPHRARRAPAASHVSVPVAGLVTAPATGLASTPAEVPRHGRELAGHGG